MNATGIEIARVILAAPTAVWASEDGLQAHLQRVLLEHGIDAPREVRLTDGVSRIDLLCPTREYYINNAAGERRTVLGGIGIEVKIKGGRADVVRQLTRYANCSEISELILVTTRAIHRNIPKQLNGKTVTLVQLIGGGL